LKTLKTVRDAYPTVLSKNYPNQFKSIFTTKARRARRRTILFNSMYWKLRVLGNCSCIAKPQGCGECRKRRSGFLPTSCIRAVVCVLRG